MFKGIRAHVVFAFPIQLSYGTEFNFIKNTFPNEYRLPMIKTHYRDGSSCEQGITTIREIIRKRISEDLFESIAVCDYIIQKTGDYLRDTFIALGDVADC